MARAIKAWTVLLAVLLIATACQTLTGATLGENIDDNAITASVKTKLVADKAINLTRVHVTTERGTVHLTGVVDSFEHKARAEQLAWEAQGVKSVINNLQVDRASAAR